MSETSKPHSDLEIVRHYLNGHKLIVDGPDGSFTRETPPSQRPALAALGRIEEQFDALHRTFEKWADEWDAIGTAEVYGPDMARWLRDKWREALNPASMDTDGAPLAKLAASANPCPASEPKP